ncbi:MAG TPA: UpxY family transcription antiterminator [Acidobacteriota bacterium]|nr:UpxY family transcription antiterminator [Acidobacteriota bacterium]
MNAHWYAVYTRSRHEKKVAAALHDRGVEVFLPLRTVINRWKDRRKELQLPLFGGYLFVRIMPEQRLPVLKVGGVVRFVGNAARPVPVPEEQIEAIRLLVESGLQYDPYPYLKEGMTITIRRGPLKGVEGILLAKKKKHLLVLSVDLIQQSAALEINISDTDVR